MRLFPFKFFDPIHLALGEGRFKARREVIAECYENWEITGPNGGGPSSLVAGHLASNPSASETFPTNLFSCIDDEQTRHTGE